MTSIDRTTILVFSDWYLPGFKAGGPIRSLVNLVNAVPYDFYIVTGNKDHHSEVKYEGVEFDCWVKLNDRIHVQYLNDEKINAREFRKIMDEINPDFVYLNSLFSPKFTLLPMRVLRSMEHPPQSIVAPRGMLKSGALSVKGFKKKWFLRVAKWLNWYGSVKWHATNKEEIGEIRKVFGLRSVIHLSPNLSAPVVANKARKEKLTRELRLVCIARISPEKGILEAIRFLKTARLEGQIFCDFIGTQQNTEYLGQCRAEAAGVPNASISFPGEIHPDCIQSTLCDYHFFYLASWGENFGHSISEALYSGMPVIISDRTPWQGLEEKKAGWVISLETEAFSVALNAAMNMTQADYTIWSDSARNFAKEISNDPTRIQMAIGLFQK
ncbi:MAG: glycosyltransferase [Flavobacteriales bacterium]